MIRYVRRGFREIRDAFVKLCGKQPALELSPEEMMWQRILYYIYMWTTTKGRLMRTKYILSIYYKANAESTGVGGAMHDFMKQHYTPEETLDTKYWYLLDAIRVDYDPVSSFLDVCLVAGDLDVQSYEYYKFSAKLADMEFRKHHLKVGGDLIHPQAITAERRIAVEFVKRTAARILAEARLHEPSYDYIAVGGDIQILADKCKGQSLEYVRQLLDSNKDIK